MANHVHLLIRPPIAPDLLLKSLKGTTARYANRLLGRTGKPFWQKESYDHWVRNDRRALRYSPREFGEAGFRAQNRFRALRTRRDASDFHAGFTLEKQ